MAPTHGEQLVVLDPAIPHFLIMLSSFFMPGGAHPAFGLDFLRTTVPTTYSIRIQRTHRFRGGSVAQHGKCPSYMGAINSRHNH